MTQTHVLLSLFALATMMSSLGCVDANAEPPPAAPRASSPLQRPPESISSTPVASPSRVINPVATNTGYAFMIPPGPPKCSMNPWLVPGGIALDFHARAARYEEIRDQVRSLAARFERAKGGDQAASGSPLAETFGLRSMLALQPHANVIDTGDGARLVLTSADPRSVERLRAAVLWNSADLLPGLRGGSVDCPIVPGE